MCSSDLPVGCRAPGYNTSPALAAAVAALGYRYDSSLLPAPAYWAARAAALGLYTLRGRRSASLVGDLRAFAGPRAPYRTTPETPWRPDPAGPLVEMPMAVSPLTRVPIIGTSWAVLPAIARRRLLRRAIASRAPLVFEMHAIDLLDASDPGVPPDLAAAQPDLRRPVREKRPLFKALFERLAGEVGLVRVCDLAAPPLTCAPAIE